jgi:prophage regulatory protein
MGARFVGSREIQKRLGVSRQRVQQLIARPDWPEPYEVLAMGKIWLREDVESWIARHRPALPADDHEQASQV